MHNYPRCEHCWFRSVRFTGQNLAKHFEKRSIRRQKNSKTSGSNSPILQAQVSVEFGSEVCDLRSCPNVTSEVGESLGKGGVWAQPVPQPHFSLTLPEPEPLEATATQVWTRRMVGLSRVPWAPVR